MKLEETRNLFYLPPLSMTIYLTSLESKSWKPTLGWLWQNIEAASGSNATVMFRGWQPAFK